MGLAASRQEAFWEACGFGHVNRVKKFLSEGVDVNWKSYTHDCCAIHVASQGKPEIVQMLLDAECDVNVRDDRGNLALHHAAMKGHSDIMQTLIDAGSEINSQDKNGWTSLHCAAYWAHPKAVQVLVNAGIDVLLQNKDKRTALHETARSKEKLLDVELGDISRMLIKAGCDINAKSSDEGEADFTPLMFSAYHGHPEVAVTLLDAGCDMNARGTNLWTALHWAADRENDEVVYILLEAGADPTCKGLRGELAADRTHSNPDLKEMLMNAVNMFKELTSVGGSNPPSQLASPLDESSNICATPLAESEMTEFGADNANESEHKQTEDSSLNSTSSPEMLERNNDGSDGNNQTPVAMTPELLAETVQENRQLAEDKEQASISLAENESADTASDAESSLAEILHTNEVTKKGDAETAAACSSSLGKNVDCDSLNRKDEFRLDKNQERTESLDTEQTTNQHES